MAASSNNNNNNNNTTDTDSPVTALMRTALDALGSRSRSVAASLRLQRDIIVDGWADRLGDLAERYAEDKRQARAHARRARHSLADRLGRRGRDREERAFPQFARLPAEIRLQIWEEALPGARAVMLRGPRGAPGGTLRDGLKFLSRSVRWRYGRLPRGARVDFAAWAEREEAGEGLSRYHTRWRDGVMAIRHGRRKSSETVAEDRAAMGS
ncbi:hypothetical protein RB597_000663 [Gaeumannomyces tritici]